MYLGLSTVFWGIDGSHIPIVAPRDNPLDYYNRKGTHSIVLQALVDYEYKFMNIYVGWPTHITLQWRWCVYSILFIEVPAQISDIHQYVYLVKV